jgi:hypothetical protein
MRRPSAPAHLLKIDHPHFPIDLGVSESAGSTDAQLVPSAEKPSDPFHHMPADSIIGLTCEAKAEVLSPSPQKAVEAGTELGPGCRVSPEQQIVDFLLQPLLGFLRETSRDAGG